MPSGTVKWFNPEKGFGFICPSEGGDDVFVHITALRDGGFDTLPEGQPVFYELVEDRRGRMSAGNLQLDGEPIEAPEPRPRRDFGDRGGQNNRGPRRDYGDRRPRRDFGDRGGYNDRGPRRDHEDRPPRRDFGNRGGYDDRGPRRDFGDRPPRRDSGDRVDGDFGAAPPPDFDNPLADPRGDRRDRRKGKHRDDFDRDNKWGDDE